MNTPKRPDEQIEPADVRPGPRVFTEQQPTEPPPARQESPAVRVRLEPDKGTRDPNTADRETSCRLDAPASPFASRTARTYQFKLPVHVFAVPVEPDNRALRDGD
jgi:hypothetical protein